MPVWLFATAPPRDETRQLCERVYVRRSGLMLLCEAQRRAWPRWVAISVGQWSGESGWILKIAPFLIPPGRALLQNAAGDFFAGKPGPVLRHAAWVLRNALTSGWHSTLDRIGGLIYKTAELLLLLVSVLLAKLGSPHCRWIASLHGTERLEIDADAARHSGVAATVAMFPSRGTQWEDEELRRFAEASDARFILWGRRDDIEDMLALFEDPQTFAVSRQRYYRAWKRMPVPLAPFRALQPGEASQVLAPVSDTILVDRAKMLALGIPRTSLSGTAWMLLFWKAAGAGWRSFSVGQPARITEIPDQPLQETSFALKVAANAGLRRIGPAVPQLARGAIAFPLGQPVSPGPLPTEGEKLRVLVVSPFLPYPLSHGGAVRIWNLCRALADRVDFALVARREKDEFVDYGKLGEVFRRVYAVDIDERASKDERLPLQVRGHESVAMRALIASLAREWQPDVLQVEYTHMAHFRDAAPGVPAVLVEHDLTFSLYRQLAESRRDEESHAEYQRWLDFEQRWLAAYDGVWTVSEEDRGVAIAESGRSPEHTFSIPNGVDLERFSPEPSGGSAEILYVGSFRHLPNLIGFEKLEREIMPRVWARVPEARLRVVAGPRHQQFWKARPLDGRIELHGFVEDLRPLYGKAAVVAVPLEVSAGTNIKVLEALACGKPVVSTVVGCAGLELQDGYDALIRSDWSTFADAICELLGDAERRRGMGARARMTAVDRFSWTSIAEKGYQSYCALKVATATCSGSV